MRVARRFCGTSVGKKIIMAMTGGCLAGFLVVHVLGNTAIYFGAHAFNSYAAHLHEFDPVLKFFELVLVLIFLIHVSFGVMLFLHNRVARPLRYAVNKSSGGSTLGSSTMLYTGVVILAFIGYHLFYVSFSPEHFSSSIAVVIRDQLHVPFVAGLYIVSIMALALHLSHGLWSLWQSLGVSHPAYDMVIRRGTLTLAVVMGTVFVSFPILAMVWDGFLQ